MNALRSSSAFARRSLATPPPPSTAPLSFSSRLLSSSSSSSFSQRSISSASLLPRHQRLAAATRWSGSIPSPYLTQTRTMASESKIKVKNPVVELDGDEVCGDLPCFYSSKLGLVWAPYHKPASPRGSGGAFSSCPSLSTRGNTGNPHSSIQMSTHTR